MHLVKRVLIFSCLLFCSYFLFNAAAYAQQFVVKKIQFEGLERISIKTFRNYLPIKEGDNFNTVQSGEIIHELYKTGFFSDVKLSNKNETLIVTVVERPVVEEINISGNKQITKKQLFEALKIGGLVEGQIFDHSVLVDIEQQIVQQYNSLGRYNAHVKVEIVNHGKSKIVVNINIDEGPVAKIKEIKIIGNNVFSQKKLLSDFSLATSNLWSFFTKSDQYSKEKLDADLEKLRSFYLDKGYLKFKIDSTQVSITPDKKFIFITIHITEGSVYSIKGFDVSGSFPMKQADIVKLIKLKEKEIFSRKILFDITGDISRFLGDFGYATPNIRVEPEINEVEKKIFIHFIVDAGKRAYVRRINFSGNTRTNENVLRREMRQQEGALFSLSKLEESKRRLENLGYLQDIDAKIEPVPNHPEQIDINYSVKEASSAMANFQVGYSDADGFLYGVNFNEQNFLGTGNSFGLGFDNSKDYKTYNLMFLKPYFTDSGISLQINGYAQRHTPGSIHLSSYTTDIYGATMMWGVPVSDFNRINFGYGYENIKLGGNSGTSLEVYNFIKSQGNVFNQIRLLAGWNFSNTDRAVFPTKGSAQAFNVDFGVPADKHSLEYYKADYILSWYVPITHKIIIKARGELGYGAGYGKTKKLPFFKNYFAGGIDSVRGYEPGSLGPRDSMNNPMGGNFLTVGSLGLIFPNPAGDSLRTSVFVDVGKVYQDKFSYRGLRSSYGVQGEWRSPLGILVFSYAKPIRSRHSDRLDAFQFNIGTSF
jgi:outer membrane protein insertion porin family